MKRVVSFLLTAVMVFGLFLPTVSTVYASEAMTKDQIALEIANSMKPTMRSEAASFQSDGRFAADLAKEIVTKESILKFCGEGFSTAVFSLANLWNYTDLITSAGEKSLYMYLCFSVINDGISYMEIGDTYFDEMNKILDKYGDDDIVAPGDARNVIKYRYYGAQYYLCGTKMCMPFIDEYANGKTLSDVFGESLYKGVSTSMGSFIIGDIFEFDDLADLWDLIKDTGSAGETITDYIKKNTIPQLDFTQIDNLLDMMTYTDDTDITTITSVAESVNSDNVNTHSTTLSDLYQLSSDKSFGNVTIENSLDLAGKTMTVNGDLYVKANVDINYGKLIVNGNLYQSSGQMYIHEGTLEITGDYRIQTYQYNQTYDKMEYVYSSGYIKMNDVDDTVKVKGSFYTQSISSSNVLVAGTMEIGGDFKQISSGDYNAYYNFDCSGTHKVVLNGSGQQHISFDYPNGSYFNDLELSNTDVVFDSKIKGWTLQRDTTFGNGLEKGMLGTFDLNGYKLTINGNLYQSGGEMFINKGTLEVTGDYRIQTYSYSQTYDKMDFSSSSGYLVMNTVKDIVKVKGNFYTQSMSSSNVLVAGTMEIGGDFKQISSGYTNAYYNFDCSGTHKVVLNGSGQQHISFDYPNGSYFNDLKLTKDKETGYIFDPDNCWKNLYLDSDIKEVTLYCIKDSLKQGLSMPITSKVEGINVPDQTVTWTIIGNTDTDTNISDGGILTIGMNEQADEIIVTATSVQDPTKSASVEISIEKIDPVINGVVINPGVVSTVCGEKCSFGAMVYGLYNPPQTVIWTVTGNNSPDTKISTDGILSIAEDETSDKLTVIATSTFDKTKSAQVDVTVMQIKIVSTVDKVTVTMATGETQKLSAVVTGSNNPRQNVAWSVSENNSKNTVISENGELTIGKDETSTRVIVRATSVEDSSKYGEFAINVIVDDNLLGDADGDGNITIMDATLVQRTVAQLTTLNEEQTKCADTDKDGNVSILDATQIQRFVAQLITEF